MIYRALSISLAKATSESRYLGAALTRSLGSFGISLAYAFSGLNASNVRAVARPAAAGIPVASSISPAMEPSVCRKARFSACSIITETASFSTSVGVFGSDILKIS